MPTDINNINRFESLAKTARCLVLASIAMAKEGHISSSMSIIDILISLYNGEIIKVNPSNPDWAKRDRFILSKAHGSIGLYAVLALNNFFPTTDLFTYKQLGTKCQVDPDPRLVRGIDIPTGPLGSGLAKGVGVSIALKMRNNIKSRVFVLIGDGELQKGQIWEAVHCASTFQLNNLYVILDNNNLQLDSKIADVFNGDISKIFASFGWHVSSVDGHSYDELFDVFNNLDNVPLPHLVIARTIKGKGIPEIENKVEYHYFRGGIQEILKMIPNDLSTELLEIIEKYGLKDKLEGLG